MPVQLFWAVIIAIVVGAWFISIKMGAFSPILCGLITVCFLVYIQYLPGDSVSLSTAGGQVVWSVPQEGVSMVSNSAFAFLAVSGFWFWVILALAMVSGFICWMNDKENIAFSILVFAGLALAAIEMGLGGFVSFLWENIWRVAGYVIGYILVSPFAAMLKWHLFGIDHAEYYVDQVNNFLRTHGRDSEKWSDTAKDHREKHYKEYKEPHAEDYKKKFIGWMMYWPLYMADTLIREFLWRVFRRLYQLVLPLLNRISRHNAVRVKSVLDGVNIDTKI